MCFNPSTKKQTTIFINRDGFQPIYKKNKQQLGFSQNKLSKQLKKINMSWEIVKLGDVVKMVTGKTPPTSNKDYFDGEYLWVNPSDFGSKYILESKRTITQKAVDEKKCNLLPKGTILLSCIGDIGKIGILNNQGASNQQITGLITKENVFPDYLYYYLINNKSQLESLANKAVVAILNNERLRDLDVVLPPLHIQKQIAQILDTADALKRKDQQLLKKYDELAQAIFIDMFGDPVKNEKGWEVKKIGSFIKDIEVGSSYGGENKNLDEGELGVLKVSAVTSGTFRSDEYKAVRKTLIQKKPIFIKQGDFLFSRANTRDLVGATCIVDQNYNHLFLSDKIWKIVFNNEKCNSIFMKSILSQKSVRYELNKTATGTSGSMLNISMQKLKDLSIIIPPIALQNNYGEIYSDLQKVRRNSEIANTNSNNLFQTLIQKAFNNELVTE
jgi:type I restriction enzyme S subunit